MTGSSPLARGAHPHLSVHEARDGLIPARAGSTSKKFNSRMKGWAHPRSRGEHVRNVRVRRTREGSSPLARGAPILPVVVKIMDGLIPARAGSTR